MFDYHMHSKNSFDGNNTIVQMAAAARDMGLSEICITEHQEIDYPTDNADLSSGADDLIIEPLDKEKYFRELLKARENIHEIKIKFGLETGLIAGSLEKIAADAKSAPFDFVIASQHVAAGIDPYYGEFFGKCGLKAGREIYLKELYDNIVNYDEFDVVGHIGYLEKYLEKNGFPDEKTFVYDDFADIIDEILKSVIARGKGIEVNTSNYKIHGTPNPHPTILKRYKELGGEIITTGSDAHYAEDIAASFTDAYRLLKDIGFKYICTFEERKPQFNKI